MRTLLASLALGAIGLLAALLKTWTARRVHEWAVTRTPDGRMVPSPFMFRFYLTGGLVVVAIAITVKTVWDKETGSLSMVRGMLAFALLMFWAAWDAKAGVHRVSADGLEHRSVLRGRCLLPWQDIRKVRYWPGLAGWRLSTEERSRWISPGLTNQALFAEMILGQMDPSALDDTTRDLLEKTIAGSPPPII